MSEEKRSSEDIFTKLIEMIKNKNLKLKKWFME